MINDKEKKMIQRYCIYPKIAVVALIFSFVQCIVVQLSRQKSKLFIMN